MMLLEELFKFFEFLGNSKTFYLIILILGIIYLVVRYQGLKIKNWIEIDSISKQKKDIQKYFTSNESKEKDIIVGFFIPNWEIILYGTSWNSHKHRDLFKQLDEKWTNQTVINISDCNITSTLISLVENKIKSIGNLTIKHTEDQESLLTYLKQYKNVKFERQF